MKALLTIGLCFICYAASAHTAPQLDSLTISFQGGFDSTEVIILVDGDVEYIKTISTVPELNLADSHTIKSTKLDKVVIQIENKQVLLPKNPPPFIGVQLSKNHEILLLAKEKPNDINE